MKKMSIYLIIIAALFGLIYVLNQQGENEVYKKPTSDLHSATRAILDDPNYQNIILPDELESRVKNGDDFFVYFFASDCPHCAKTTPVLMPLAKKMGVDLPQFNLREYTDHYGKYNIEYTPTLAYFKDGKEIGRLVGGIKEEGTNVGYTEEDYTNFFQKYGVEGKPES